MKKKDQEVDINRPPPSPKPQFCKGSTMKLSSLTIGFSPLTRNVYIGKAKGNQWIGEKKNITSRFNEVVLDAFPPGETFEILINGEKKYEISVKEII